MVKNALNLPNWSVYSLENNKKNYCHQISSFKAKMRQIRFRLGLCPRPRWLSSQRSPSPLAAFQKSYTLRKRGEKKTTGEGKRGEGEGRKGKWKKKGKGDEVINTRFWLRH